MLIAKKKSAFEAKKRIYESALITFKGVEGWDVYNCSMLFMWKGKRHMYGRVEKREEWANSHVRLFVETGKDEFTVLPGHSWELEDPYVQKVNGELIFGGTHTRKSGDKIMSYYGFFFRGDPVMLRYFTSGPDYMKDIRLITLKNGRIGVFSRKRDSIEAFVGFTIIDNIEHLSMEAIASAKRIDLFEKGTWGGVNQAYLLSTGKIGCIAHYSYNDTSGNDKPLAVYVNYSFVFDPDTRQVFNEKIIGTKGCYPPVPSKLPFLEDCAFTSGIVMREDGKCDLYSGLGDTSEGRITIDYPFEGYGEIAGDLSF